jgi:hypothetical protein
MAGLDSILELERWFAWGATTEYTECHRLSLQSSELAPHAPFDSGGGTHSLAREGAGEPIRTKEQTLLMLSVYVVCTSIIPQRAISTKTPTEVTELTSPTIINKYL